MRSVTATFEFSSEPGATFECRLDEAPFGSCSSPRTFTGLSNGAHTFRVRAKDAVGNIDASPATRAWKVDTIAPTVTDTTPSGNKVSPTANVTATFSEAMDEGSVEASGVFRLMKQGTNTALNATVSYDPATKKLRLNPSANLKRGTYKATISTGAEDEAGNALAQPKSWTFTVS